MNVIKVSVIVPVFNVEKYLRCCLESLCSQTLKEIEFICVDDGSTDSSVAIIEEYAKDDDRIVIIKQKNQYAGVARNSGMKIARGEYLLFLDSDDFFKSTMLEKLYNKCKHTDAEIGICGGQIYDEQTQECIPARHFLNMKMLPQSECFSNEDVHKRIFNFTSPAPWNKMFKRSFIKENHLEFQCIQRSNDLFFTYATLALAQRITIVPEVLVNYRKGNGNSLQETNQATPLVFCDALEALKVLLDEKGLFEKFRQSYVNRALDTSLYNLNIAKSEEVYCRVYEKVKRDIISDLKIVEYGREYIYSKKHYESMVSILELSAEEMWKRKINVSSTSSRSDKLSFGQKIYKYIFGKNK